MEAKSFFRYAVSLPVSLAPMIVWEIVGNLPTRKLISGVLGGGLLIIFHAILSDLGGSRGGMHEQ